VPRLRDEKAWTPADQAVVGRHLAHLQAASVAGKLVLAGRTQEPLNQTFGIAIFEAPDDAAARAFMQSDPAVSESIMTAELHPYRIAAQRQP
ncbi:MAG: YciI family protein, partial [Burkholderiales bacterium]